MEKPASPVQEPCFNGLIDTDGENKAVRALLMLYGDPGLTVGKMKKHLSMSGFKMWPAWVEQEHGWAHLTKAGAQLWIRHLFALEATPPAAQSAVALTREQHIALREAFAIGSADSYFEAYPTHDNDVGRMLFERGFARGFDSHERAIATAHGIKGDA